MEFDELSNRVIGCAIEVHRHVGLGLLESAYEHRLAHELSRNEIAFPLQLVLPLQYQDVRLDCGYRIDILVENQLIVELKSGEEIKGIHEGRMEDRITNELQRDKTVRWHPTFRSLRSLISWCSSCPSW